VVGQGPGKIRMYSGMTRPQTTNTVTSEHSVTK